MKKAHIVLSIVLGILLFPSTSYCQVKFKHQKDVVYGYKDGMALVMDVYSPKESLNAAGVILVMAGGMTSSPIWSHNAGDREDVQNLLKAGYVVFAAAHSSQPKYNADEISKDIPRAVRFIRYNSKQFKIKPNHIGILGYSSGAHVSLMTATDPPVKKIESDDPVDEESSKVQAVVAYYPSSDLLNFGKEDTNILEHFHSVGYNLDAAFDFHTWDKELHRFERIENLETIRDYYKKNSAINFVTNDDPPIMIIHGDEDKLVPLQQSKMMIKKLKAQNIPCKLLVIEGKGHAWDTPVENEYSAVLRWFNQFLR